MGADDQTVDDADGLLAQASELVERGDDDGARELYERLVDKDRGSLGRDAVGVQVSAADYALVELADRRGFDYEPRTGAGWQLRGALALRRTGQGAGAEAALRRAIEDGCLDAYLQLGELLTGHPNRSAERTEALVKALESTDSDVVADAAIRLAVTAELEGLAKDAADHYEMALSAGDDNIQMRAALHLARLAAGERDVRTGWHWAKEGVEAARRERALEPRGRRLHSLFAWALVAVNALPVLGTALRHRRHRKWRRHERQLHARHWDQEPT